ncbi:glycosyltransferase [Succinivibrio dextrinosolvens]|uniref:glycosyltransferase n=1 Tax=Succinivibrio dextrinosolvens TaxID=83771 RepID=UPI0009433C97|nr:glycosyltransferase [Succinivibrio dextrinosolvens]
MCVSASNDEKTSTLYQNLLKVALRTATQNTSLDIVVLYDGPENHPFRDIIDSYPVKRIDWVFSHFEDLKKTFTKDILLTQTGRDSIDFKKLAGTFMRLDIPFIEKEESYVLYADIDVMFMADLNLESLTKPKVLMVGPEFKKTIQEAGYFNAGIIYFNVEEMRKKSELIFKQLENHIPNSTGLFDQGYLNEFCLEDYEELPLEYNWKPYWGTNDNARIIHFHGIKPGGSENASGFASTLNIFEILFRGHFEDLVGYSRYLRTFFSLCNTNQDEWLYKHLTAILQRIEKDSFRENYTIFRRLRKKYIKSMIFNFLTLGLTAKFRNRVEYFGNELEKFFPKD